MIRKIFRNIRIYDNDISSLRIPLRIFSPHSFAEVIFNEQVRVIFHFLHNTFFPSVWQSSR